MSVNKQNNGTATTGGGALLAAALSLLARSADDVARVSIHCADDFGRVCVSSSDDLGLLVTRTGDDLVRYADDVALRAQAEDLVRAERFEPSRLIDPDDGGYITSRIGQEALKEGVQSLGRLEWEDER